jgi:hypothetical protein
MVFNKTRFAVVAATLLAVCATAAWTAEDASYEVNFARPVKVGDKFDLTVTVGSKMRQTTAVEGKDPAEQKNEVAYAVKGVKEVLKVDAKGNATEISFTVETAVKIEGDKKTEVAKKGAVAIIKEKDGRKVAEAKEGTDALSADAQEVLTEALDIHTKNSPDDNAIFGNEKGAKVGESWKVNKAEMLKFMSRDVPTIKEDSITGEVTLAGISKEGNDKFLDLKAAVSVKGAIPGLPPTAHVEEAELNLVLEGKLPLDGTSPMASSHQAMVMKAVFVVDGDGGKTKITIDMAKIVERKETPKE